MYGRSGGWVFTIEPEEEVIDFQIVKFDRCCTSIFFELFLAGLCYLVIRLELKTGSELLESKNGNCCEEWLCFFPIPASVFTSGGSPIIWPTAETYKITTAL